MMLDGARIWLSGSIPETATADDTERIQQFIRAFAAEVFRRGGIIVHGSHPTIRDELLDAARRFKEATGKKAGLVLVVSRYYTKEEAKYGIDLAAWDDLCVEPVIETPEALPDPTAEKLARRQRLRSPHRLEDVTPGVEPAAAPVAPDVSKPKSLAILRETLTDQGNAIVAVGGKWWTTDASHAGVPDEVERAQELGMPLFLLGAMGGSLRSYLERRPELIRACRNGLSEDENRELASIDEPAELSRRICDQISRLPLRLIPPRSTRPFRILCLDGGGICGAFTAAVLRQWEVLTGCSIAEHFDLIAGTSTGGLLAIGLGLGMKPAEMVEFYLKEGPVIFPSSGGLKSMTLSLRHWFLSKFDSSVLERAVAAAYGGAAIQPPRDAFMTRVMVTAYNSETDRPEVFRAWPDARIPAHRTFNPVPAALATAAAPTYFQPVRMDDILAVDGGVWANSPSAIALAEAVHGLGVTPERIYLLSVGTTYDTRLIGRPAQLDRGMIESLVRPATNGLVAKLVALLWRPVPISGKLGWLPNIAGFLMKTQSQSAEYVCRRVLGDRFVRVDVATEPTPIDNAEALPRLIGLGRSVADEFLPEVRTQFLNGVPAGGP
jgi:hypothetical protein